MFIKKGTPAVAYCYKKGTPAVAYCYDSSLKEYDSFVKIYTSKDMTFQSTIKNVDKEIWNSVIKLYKNDDRFSNVVCDILEQKYSVELSYYIKVFHKDGWLVFLPDLRYQTKTINYSDTDVCDSALDSAFFDSTFGHVLPTSELTRRRGRVDTIRH